MKTLIYTDPQGYKFNALVRDTDTNPAIGVLSGPPHLSQIEWPDIGRELHNTLLDKGFFSVKDVQIRQTEFNQIILATVGKKIFRLYQQEET